MAWELYMESIAVIPGVKNASFRMSGGLFTLVSSCENSGLSMRLSFHVRMDLGGSHRGQKAAALAGALPA
jgi:hypothetical protein